MMKRKSYFVLAIALLVCLAGWTGYSQKSQASKTSWEYLVINDPTTGSDEGYRKMNELGAQGWELVGVSNEVINQGNQTFTKLFFKRAK